jgi:hypothetical protein
VRWRRRLSLPPRRLCWDGGSALRKGDGGGGGCSGKCCEVSAGGAGSVYPAPGAHFKLV